MSIDDFWSMVARIHAASGGNMEFKCRLLADELRKFSAGEVQSFDEHFSDCVYRAYTEDIWGAAFVINEGCGDDKFMDFRSTLISLGRAPFEAALGDADSLAGFEIDPAWAQFEGYQYVAPTIYKEVTGGVEMPRSACHPTEPIGNPFKEWEMSARFPRLVAKYKYKDSDWLYLKEAEEKRFQNGLIAENVAKIALESGVIPPCGLIPPFRVVADVLRTGRAPESTNRRDIWTPFELQQEHYWSAIMLLENMPLEDRKARPDLVGVTLRQDFGVRAVEGFDDWMRSLKERGLA